MTYKFLSAFIVGAMAATPILAQATPDNSDMSAPAISSEHMATTPAAMPMAVAVPEGYTLTELSSMTADQLKGVDIYDPMDEKIAEIADVVIGDGNKVTGIVTDVGGFLGMGERRISLSPEQISIYKDANNNIRVYVSMSKDELKALPEYEAPN